MKIDFEKGGGLVPAIIQDATTKKCAHDGLHEPRSTRQDAGDKEGYLLESFAQLSLDQGRDLLATSCTLLT